MSTSHLPILRFGEPYHSLDIAEVTDARTGEVVAAVSQANPGLIRRDARRFSAAREALSAIEGDEFVALCARAGELFVQSDLPMGEGEPQSPQRFVELLSATTGLPHSLCRQNMDKIHQVFTEMEAILRGLTRGMDLDILRTGFGRQHGVPVSYFPVTEALGVILPSNSPGVNSLWMPALPLRIPVALKPGSGDPWTPFRVVQAFVAAGCPPQAFGFYPTSHEGGSAVMECCGRSLIFGDESTVARYAGNPNVEVHGPGRSKIVLGSDAAEHWPEYLEVMVTSILRNGGRSCVNASTIVTPSRGGEIADALAKRLAAIEPLPLTDQRAALAGFTNADIARWIDEAVEEGLGAPGAEEATARYRCGPRLVELEGLTYLRPTVVMCETMDHPLANREFLFPYAGVVEVSEDAILDVIGPTLVVSLITEDEGLIARALHSPNIQRLNLGPAPTTQVSWDQPHEGNLFEFLYRRRAIQRAVA